MILMAKNAEVGGAKIFDPEGEEMVVEQMVLTSGVNVQLEQMIKLLKAREFPIYNPPSPRELECLGMKLSDMNLLFRKGFFELSFDYKKVTEPSAPEVCEKFYNMMRKGPDSIVEEFQDKMGGQTIADYLQQKRDTVDGYGEARKESMK